MEYYNSYRIGMGIIWIDSQRHEACGHNLRMKAGTVADGGLRHRLVIHVDAEDRVIVSANFSTGSCRPGGRR